MWRLALRNVARKPARSLLSVVGLAVALGLVIGLVSFAYGVRALLDGALRQVKGLVVINRDSPQLILSKLPLTMLEELERVPGIAVVVPEVWHVAITIDGGKLLLQSGLSSGGLGILGTDLERRAQLPGGGVFGRALVEGRFIRSDDVHACVISREIAQKLGRRLGDTLALPGAKPLEVVGVFETGSSILDTAVIVPVTVVRQMKGIGDEWVTSYYVELHDPSGRDAMAKELDRRFPEARAFTPDEINKTLGDVLDKLDLMLLAIIVLPIIGAAVAVLNTMLMSFSERVAEFGVLAACGWRRRDLVVLVLGESLVLGFLGGLVGMVTGFAATRAAGEYLAVVPVAPGWLYPLCLGLALVLGAVGGTLPAWKAARLDPVEAIRRG